MAWFIAKVQFIWKYIETSFQKEVGFLLVNINLSLFLLSTPEKFIKEYIIWGMKTVKRFIQGKQSKNPKFLSGFEPGTLEY